MFSQEKGITPVIAIVLLLLITVGAVGVVYTQFQSLTEDNQAQDRLQNQQRLQASNYKIIGVEKNTNDAIDVTVKNTADDVTLNLSERAVIQIGKSGGNPQAVSVLSNNNNPCDWGTGGADSPTPGESATCSTDVSWPSSTNDGQLESFEILIDESTKDSYTCDAGSNYC